MKARYSIYTTLLLLSAILFSSCAKKVADDRLSTDTTQKTVTVAQPVSTTTTTYNYPVTLPVVDAFFADSGFVQDSKKQLQLSDSDIVKVRNVAHNAVSQLNEDAAPQSSTTPQSQQLAQTQLTGAIGADKANKLISYIRDRWAGVQTTATSGDSSSSIPDSLSPAGKVNNVPGDSRIVVNIPEFRMDVFDSGQLSKSYKIAIGYPEFPLPVGMRKASTIIINPTWTPPDELWVDTSSKVSAGQKIAAGDKLNPLGALKIPIGLPSLIHGGKSEAKLGNYGSHGCVGLTDAEVKEFAPMLAQLGGATLSPADISAALKNRKVTKETKLTHTVPVELRYETMVLENGKLHIFPDVYSHDVNSWAMVNKVLTAYGSDSTKLTASERTSIDSAIKVMGQFTTNSNSEISYTATADTSKKAAAKKSAAKSTKPATAKGTASKLSREVVVPIAALAGQGYPEWYGKGTSTKTSTSASTKKQQ